MSTIKLFCLPYAGGSAAVYSQWKQYLNPNVTLEAIELAGRGVRINEPLYNTRADAVSDVFQIIQKKLNDMPYMIFGHSMGALMAFELALKIKEEGLTEPLHMFFSGASAPHLRDERKQYHLLNEQEFEKEVISLGGTPPEFFQHKELLEMFLPILRNDFKMTETDLQSSYEHVLNVDFTVLQGEEDDLTAEQREHWDRHTSKHFEIHNFQGGHFFLHDNVKTITDIVNKAYAKKVRTIF